MGARFAHRLVITRRRLLQLAAAAGSPMLACAACAAHIVRPWPEAKAVPALDLADLDGKRWTLGGLAGRVVLLNFWATWCEPCRLEMPSLESVASRYRAGGMNVLAVNYRERPAVIREFLASMSFKATILLDADGDAAAEWTPRVFPSTVLIGRDGRPTATVLGDLDWNSAAARGLLEPLLAAPAKT